MECILFLYLCVNYYEKEIFRYIMNNVDFDEVQEVNHEVSDILKDSNAYDILWDPLSKERFKFNNSAFAITVHLNGVKLAGHILTNSKII